MLLLLSPWLMDPASCFGQAQPYDQCTGSYFECVDADADGQLGAQELPPCALEACDLNGDGNVTLGECATHPNVQNAGRWLSHSPFPVLADS